MGSRCSTPLTFPFLFFLQTDASNRGLAIWWAVDSLHYYLLGRSSTLCLDHAPLQWLHLIRVANSRINRWHLDLQPFKFKVVHKPGVQMAVAAFLSRLWGIGRVRPDGSLDPIEIKEIYVCLWKITSVTQNMIRHQ